MFFSSKSLIKIYKVQTSEHKLCNNDLLGPDSVQWTNLVATLQFGQKNIQWNIIAIIALTSLNIPLSCHSAEDFSCLKRWSAFTKD